MPLPDQFDTAAGYAFSVKIDGVEIPQVMEVSGIKTEVEKIEYKQQASDGKFIVRQMMGRVKPGEIKLKRGLTDSTTVTDWFKMVFEGKLQEARKTAEVAIYTSDGVVLKRMNYTNVWIKDIEVGGSLKAGATEPLTESFTLCWDEMEFA